MQELIAKRYVKALIEAVGADSLENVSVIFDALSQQFSDAKFVQIMSSADIASTEKEAILIASVEKSGSTELTNFIKLLVEQKRIDIIPAIAKALTKAIAKTNKQYTGTVYSDSDIDAASITGLSEGLSKKVDASVTLEFVKTDFDGIKVEVEDLGVEVNFSKTRLNTQLVEHILKAI